MQKKICRIEDEEEERLWEDKDRFYEAGTFLAEIAFGRVKKVLDSC